MRRFPRAAAGHFEALEPRQLQSRAPAAAAVPTPGDGNDYVMLAPDAGGPVVQAQAQAVTRTPLPGGFTWFDGTAWNRLSTVVPGVTPMSIGGAEAFPAGANAEGDVLDEASTRAWARRTMEQTGVLVIDIEHWTMSVAETDQGTVRKNVALYAQVIDWCRDEEPGLKIGIYGELPGASIWGSAQMGWAEDTYAATGSGWHRDYVSDAATLHAQWQAACDFVKPLAAKVDYLFPSLYTFYDNQDQWTRAGKALIDEARMFGKPVIPFIWPEYHNGGDFPGKMLQDDYWQLELDTVRRYADGAVIWYDKTFAPGASWVRAVDAMRTTDSFATRATQRVVAATFAATFGATSIGTDEDDATSPRAAALLAA